MAQWEDTPARKANRDRIKNVDYGRPLSRPAHSWFRVFKHSGEYEDVPASMSECTGYKMKKRAYQLYDAADVKAVAVLNEEKSRVLWSVQNAPKRQVEGVTQVDVVMTIVQAMEEIDKLPLRDRLNTADYALLAQTLMTNVNAAFAIGRLDKEVVG